MNNLQELKKCLKGFENQSFSDFKIFICVDGSTDGTLEYLEEAKFSYDLKVLTHPNNAHGGRNKTRNLALKIISAKYILLFDSDIVPDAEILKKHYELLEKNNCVSVGDIIYENRNENLWALYLYTRGKNKYDDLSEIPIHYLNTQNVAFKANYFNELEGQDPELSKNYGGDDTILGYRIGKDFNIPAVFNKTAVGFSIMDKSLTKALKQMQEFGSVNLKIIRRKYPEFKQIFRFDIAESDSMHHKLFRLFLRDWLARLMKRTINFLPNIMKI